MEPEKLAERPDPLKTTLTQESVDPHDSKLAIYPDMILRQPVKAEIKNFDRKLTSLIIEMFETMKALGGIGLAAPQINRKLPVITYSVGADEGCLVNPVITDRSGKLVESLEGCLSMPGVKVKVPRHEKIRVQYHDEDGMIQTLDASHLLARCIQHEVDHLNGKTMLDYLSKLKRDTIASKLKKNDRRWNRYIKDQKKNEYNRLNQLKKALKDHSEFLTPPTV